MGLPPIPDTLALLRMELCERALCVEAASEVEGTDPLEPERERLSFPGTPCSALFSVGEREKEGGMYVQMWVCGCVGLPMHCEAARSELF